jgi:hypothetical protein
MQAKPPALAGKRLGLESEGGWIRGRLGAVKGTPQNVA